MNSFYLGEIEKIVSNETKQFVPVYCQQNWVIFFCKSSTRVESPKENIDDDAIEQHVIRYKQVQ